jgi:hypothetical protein
MSTKKHDLDIDSDIRGAITLDIKACPFSRAQIASRRRNRRGNAS